MHGIPPRAMAPHELASKAPSAAGSASAAVEESRVEYLGRSARTYLTLVLYAAIAPWGYALFGLLLIAPISVLRRRRLFQACIRSGFRLLRGWVGTFRLARVDALSVRENLLPERCVVVANHPSHFDIVSLLSRIPRCATIVKPSIYDQWWLEPLMRGSGQVRGTSHPLDAGRLVEAAVARLHEGERLVVFPEGTRTEAGREMPFHRLAFEIASRAHVPVVPIRIDCDPPFLSKGQSVLRPPRAFPRIRLEVLDPIDPESFGGDTRSLRDHVRNVLLGTRNR
ncbi:MAG: lysophospholipid acyltransferase family protein [Myxococcota bacterium]